MPSLAQQIKGLQQDIDDIIAGYYTPPTALGPNTLSKNSVKAKTIRSGNIDVTNLESVQTKTGSLTVDGNLTIGTGGSLRSGKTSYADTSNAGFWMGIDSSVAVIRIGNIGHTSGMVWDGTTLAITGTVTATSGRIGGWDISSTDLSADSGAIGMASSGSVRFWSGHTTPSSAPFQVSSAGKLTSTSAAIGGWDVDSTGIRLGSGATARGMDSGSTAFYAGSSTPSSAPYRVTTAGVLNATGATLTTATVSGTLSAVTGTLGALTVNGTLTLGTGSITSTNWSITSSGVMTSTSGTIGGLTINANDLTVPSGKKLKFGASAADYIDNNVLHFEMTGSETGKIEFKNGSNTPYGEVRGNVSSTRGFVNILGSYDSNSYARVYVDGIYSGGLELSTAVMEAVGATTAGSWIVGDTYAEFDYLSSTRMQINSSGHLYTYGRMYPGTGSATQTNRYFSDNGTRMVLTGGDLDINNMTTASPGNTAWASRGFSADGGGYVVLYVNGTGYKVPTYA